MLVKKFTLILVFEDKIKFKYALEGANYLRQCFH